MNDRMFQDCKSIFKNQAIRHFEASPEYSAIEFRLDKVLLLADRLLAACDGHPHHGRVSTEVRLRLGKLLAASESGDDTSPAAVDLLGKLEIWLKSILWLAVPEKWERAREKSEEAKTAGKPSRFNLYQVVQDLGLLSEQEIQTPVERCSEISDSVRQLILCAKEDRNPLEHEGAQIPHHVRERLLSSSLVAYLAPIIRYQSELQEALGRVVTVPPDFGTLAPLARQIDSERRGHIERFAGREEWLSTLTDKLTGQFVKEGGYILLTATEGTGKSAIVSMLSQQWSSSSPILGTHSTHVQKVAPWLPSVVLHLGKASNLPSEIVPFLLEQIRCQLVSTLPAFGEIFPDSRIQDGMEQELNRIGRDGASAKSRDRKNTDGDDASYRVDVNTESPSRSSGYLHARRFLFDALEKLVSETGRVVLLIDALEEISSDGSRLEFLPERLPPGVSCLLTSRPQTAAETFVRSRLKNVEPIELKQLKREEIPLLTKVDDAEADGRQFNNKVFESSDGLPLLVSGIGRSVAKASDFKKVQVRGVRDRHFELKAKEWTDSGEMNQEILGLLSIFEPVMPVDLAVIQAYLESRDVVVELAEIRRSLKPVSTQLQGLDISRVKLAMRPFAEHIRERHFSPRDLFVRFKRVVDWLLEDDEIKPDVFGRLFMVWTNLQASSEGENKLSRKHKELLKDLPSILLEKERGELLFRSASRILRESEDVNATAIECLRNAAQLGSLEAMRTFSNLIDGDHSEELKQEAIDWVQKGAELQDAASMMIIGNRLIDGTGLAKDVEAGSVWLRKSAEAGLARAMTGLGMRLVQGDGLEKDSQEGLTWLNKASEENHVPANFMLGLLLVTGDQVEQDVEEGVIHLEKAIESGFVPAILFLSSHYMNGIHVEKDVERGIALLEKAISLDDESAVLSLAHRYFTGDAVEQSEEKGLAILETGVTKNQTLAKRALGYELVTAKNVSVPDHERGALLLEDAIEAGDAPSMEILAEYLLDEKKEESEKARQLLIRATEEGYDSAIVNLAKRLAKGKGLPKSLEEAMELLRKYASEDRQHVRWELGRALIEGRYGEQDLEEGKEIMEALCEDGNLPAKRYLGLELLEGTNLPQDAARGFVHLESAVSEGDTDAMIALGKYLVASGESAEKNEEGIEFLLRAEKSGDFEASFELGMLYLEGKDVEQDVELGLRLVQKADSLNYIPAMVVVAKELISGERLPKDDQAAMARLTDVGKRMPPKLALTGFDFYKMGRHYWAAWCFLTAFKSGVDSAGNNLAYMVRRGEVPEDLEVPNPLALLAKGAKECEGYALVNQALCNASGVGTKVDWAKADQSIARVPSLADLRAASDDKEDPDHPCKWWHLLTSDPEHAAEGHLVLGWLVQHRKIEDPDGLKTTERFRLAREGGWPVPDSFFE